MKNLTGMKRIVAIATCFALAMTMCALPAFADKGAGAPAKTGALAGSQIAAALDGSQAGAMALAGGQKVSAMAAFSAIPDSNPAVPYLNLSWNGDIVSGKSVNYTATSYNLLKPNPAEPVFVPSLIESVSEGTYASLSIDALTGVSTGSYTLNSVATKNVTVLYVKISIDPATGTATPDTNYYYTRTFPVTVKGTVNFKANGGSPSAARYAAQGGKFSFPGNPKRSSFKFNGWYTASVGGKKLTSSSTANFGTPAAGTAASMSVYAHWAKKVKVSFNLSKGKFSSSQKKKYANSKKPFKVTTSEKYGSLPTPSYKGYRFFGWWQGSKRIDKNAYVAKESNHSLKAKWLKKGSGSTFNYAEDKILANNLSTVIRTKNPGYLMTLADVRAVIGGSGQLSASYKTSTGIPVKVYRWKVQGTNQYIYLHFVKGKYFETASRSKSYKYWQSILMPLLP